jgi:hypothetical protein
MKQNNVAASVRQRLLNKRSDEHRTFDELLQYYAMERFLYRLGKSRYRLKFILKGALLLRVWKVMESRPTMDIDMLGKTGNDPKELEIIFKEICSIEAEDDGLFFKPESVKSEPITRDANYTGTRILFLCKLENSRIHMQVDIGFGDNAYPPPVEMEMPAISGQIPPRIIGYRMETSIAEKFHAMVELSDLNSRMKDFNDIWILARQFDFDGKSLAIAISRTFKSRGKNVPQADNVFTPEFAALKQIQWQAFRRKFRITSVPENFAEIVVFLSEFLGPLLLAVSKGDSFTLRWKSPETWY